MLRFVHNTKIQLMIVDVCIHSRLAHVFWYLTTHHSNLSSSKHWFHWAPPTGNSRIRERVFAAFSVAGSSGQNRTVNHRRVGKSPGFAVISLLSQCWIFRVCWNSGKWGNIVAGSQVLVWNLSLGPWILPGPGGHQLKITLTVDKLQCFRVTCWLGANGRKQSRTARKWPKAFFYVL